MVEVKEKTNGKLDEVAESKQKLEADKCDREQRAIELFNKCITEIQGRELRCAINFIWVTKDNGTQIQKGVEISIKAND